MVRINAQKWIIGLGVLTLITAAQAGEHGTVSLDTRFRAESAEIAGTDDAENLSVRTRIGFTTSEKSGVQAMVEGEFTFVADKDDYNAAGVHGDTTKAVIADPENQQLDQLWVSYTNYNTKVKAGRQLLTIDNHRYIGHVGWRQNRQTYDAVTVVNTSIENLRLFYGYIDNVVRIFGNDAPSSGGNAEEAGSESHVVNVAYKACDAATITAYAYLLDLEDIPATLSSDTYGIAVTGKSTCENGCSLGYRAEYAMQSDAGDNPDNYDADYVHLNVNLAQNGFIAEAGYEVLGADRTGVDTNGAPAFASFKTPLATGHKFNGYADRFLVTPANGLEDIYVMLGYTLQLGEGVGPLTAKVYYHDFSSDKGSMDLGDEIDVVLVKPLPIDSIPGKLTAIVKLSEYNAGDAGADTTRLSGEVNWGVTF